MISGGAGGKVHAAARCSSRGAVDHADAKFSAGPGGVLHRLGCAAADAGRVAIAPDDRRQDGLVPGVERVSTPPGDAIVRQGRHFQGVPLDKLRRWLQ